ncbi:MAG: hypothetical protein FWG98_12125 [Candidatus Cloacimonetes bacterium]|nr:hypothetical protein [Candidatus Cloacimonadota bacterium]
MSGPKIDHAELERQRQIQLERQRQERLRKIREETDKLNKEISKTERHIAALSRHLMSEVKKIGKSDEMSSVIDSLKELKERYCKQLEKALSLNVPTEPNEIARYSKSLVDITNSAVLSYFNESKKYEELIKEFVNHLEIQEKLKAIKFDYEKEEIKNIEDFDFTLRSVVINISDKIETDIKDRATKILAEIEDYINSESLQVSDCKLLYKIANSIYQSAFGAESGFKAAENEYNTIKPNITKNIEKFDDLYQEYYAEYVIYLEIVNQKTNTKKIILPKEKHRFVSIEHLQHEKDQLASQSKIENEKKYIREQIDEMMKEFGYNTSKEIVFGDNHKGNHFICNNSTGTSAIHVHLSDEKQIMMEIVAIETEPGIADDDLNFGLAIRDTDLNENDNNYLMSQMGSFCELHPKIVESLNKKGVIFNMKTRREPDKKYCKKVYLSNSKENIIVKQDNLVNEFDQYQTKRSAKKLAEMALTV